MAGSVDLEFDGVLAGVVLAMEERLVTQAGADTAPRPTRAAAARALGAGLAQLEDTLAGRAQEFPANHPERTGLSADQSAAVLSVLSDGQRVSVINAPAGSGKTRVMTEAARAWAAAGRGPVIGITPSQSAGPLPSAYRRKTSRQCAPSGIGSAVEQ